MKQKALAQLLFLFFATALSIFALVMLFSYYSNNKYKQRTIEDKATINLSYRIIDSYGILVDSLYAQREKLEKK